MKLLATTRFQTISYFVQNVFSKYLREKWKRNPSSDSHYVGMLFLQRFGFVLTMNPS